MKKILCVILAVMIMILGIVPAFAISKKNIKSGMTLWVKTSGGKLNMHEEDFVESNVIYKLPNGSPVTATKHYSHGALKVVYSVGGTRVEGWVDIKYLTDTKPGNESKNNSDNKKTEKETVASLNFRSYKLVPQDTVYVITSKPSRVGGYVNLRWAPSLDSAVIARMERGTEMRVIAEGKSWLQVQHEEGWVGFISKQFTEDIFRGTEADWEAFQTSSDIE